MGTRQEELQGQRRRGGMWLMLLKRAGKLASVALTKCAEAVGSGLGRGWVTQGPPTPDRAWGFILRALGSH